MARWGPVFHPAGLANDGDDVYIANHGTSPSAGKPSGSIEKLTLRT
ncbi:MULTISPECIES: hypothetical protein [unclassified Amycolatopsis]